MRKKKKINLKQGVVREGGRDKIGTLWELYVIRIRTGGPGGGSCLWNLFELTRSLV